MTRREFVSASAALAAVGASAADAESRDAPELAAAKKWFREAQFGMMAHWGLYSLLAGEWRGRRCGAYSEWIEWTRRIPSGEYAALASAFNPLFFDPKDWMKRARDAGMRYFVFTAKHHDGFAMYRSKVSRFNVVDATPFRRDVVEELAEACRGAGLRFGLYYSQDVDWSEPNGGGLFRRHHIKSEPRVWGNDWDFGHVKKEDYRFEEYLEAKSVPQVTELLTQYGDLCLVWFDVPVTCTPEQSRRFRDLVRRHQPGCLINGRIGNGLGDYVTPTDNALATDTRPDRLYEMVGTMNGSWGYHPTDTRYRTVDEIAALREKCRSIGSNYMLNIGPDHLGRIPAPGVAILEGLAASKGGLRQA